MKFPKDVCGFIGSFESDAEITFERIKAGIFPKTTVLYNVNYTMYKSIKDENYNIISLDLSNCGLTELPKLPDRLIDLKCGGNRLVSLPELPKGLKVLNCSWNRIVSLPEKMPDSLKIYN